MLDRQRYRDEGLAALASSPVLAAVKRLYLARNPIGDEGARALADSPHVGALRELGLGSVEDIGDDGAQALVDSTQLASCIGSSFPSTSAAP